MQTSTKPLGIMRPLGGGDPIPLKTPEVMIGRRKSCEVHLDFENVSGRHCQLRFHQGVWHVRDLHSTNGTTINGQPIASEHEVMPDDALGVAGHMFMIDYEPVAPTSIMDAKHILEEEMAEGTGSTRRRSLMELAGLTAEGESSYRLSRVARASERAKVNKAADADRRPETAPRPQPQAVPEPAPVATEASSGMPELSDDEFLALIGDDVKSADDLRSVPKAKR